jgi:hypothetical protein
MKKGHFTGTPASDQSSVPPGFVCGAPELGVVTRPWTFAGAASRTMDAPSPSEMRLRDWTRSEAFRDARSEAATQPEGRTPDLRTDEELQIVHAFPETVIDLTRNPDSEPPDSVRLQRLSERRDDSAQREFPKVVREGE